MIGVVISGSLNDGFLMRLSPSASIEAIKTGLFVAIQGSQYRFFAVITDLKLTVSHPDILQHPPEPHESLLRDVLVTHSMYAVATVRPMLMIDTHGAIHPVTAIPPHFAPVVCATDADIKTIFGDESDASGSYFSIGKPLGMQAPVCLDLQRVGERSTGIFGKTGTGKTFLTRLLLAGIVSRARAVCLIFDMHSEYGFQARTEGSNAHFVKGLKTLFPERVAIFSLDPDATRRRGLSPDRALQVSYQAVHVEDILSLQEELNLHPTACEAAYLLAARYRNEWLSTLLSQGDTLKELAVVVGAHPESIAALYRKLKPIERLPFMVNQSDDVLEDVMSDMVASIDRGISIIVEFGTYSSTLCYLLIANIITRRIHELYTAKTERYLASRRSADEPKQLIIVIEEAHKFLHPAAARQTTFGVIAREMRKYYVSLLIVDQRPSGIDSEVVSQIGTKLVAQLNDERDIQAVVSGVSGQTAVRQLIATLGSKQQAVIFGHAVPVPLVVETRRYDEHLYRAILNQQHADRRPIRERIDELY